MGIKTSIASDKASPEATLTKSNLSRETCRRLFDVLLASTEAKQAQLPEIDAKLRVLPEKYRPCLVKWCDEWCGIQTFLLIQWKFESSIDFSKMRDSIELISLMKNVQPDFEVVRLHYYMMLGKETRASMWPIKFQMLSFFECLFKEVRARETLRDTDWIEQEYFIKSKSDQDLDELTRNIDGALFHGFKLEKKAYTMCFRFALGSLSAEVSRDTRVDVTRSGQPVEVRSKNEWQPADICGSGGFCFVDMPESSHPQKFTIGIPRIWTVDRFEKVRKALGVSFPGMTKSDGPDVEVAAWIIASTEVLIGHIVDGGLKFIN